MGQSTGSSNLVSYRCPGCQAALQGRGDRFDAWLRCPRCGRPGRPPAPEPVPSEPPPPGGLADEIDTRPPVVLLPVSPEGVEPASLATRTLAAALARRSEAPRARDWRVLYASGLFVAVTMLVFSYLDSSVIGTSVFGTLAFFCLVLLVLPGLPER